MRNPGGYLQIVEPGRPDVEHDTFTCCHCGSIVLVNARQSPADSGGFCLCCMKPICKGCATKGGCDPFMKKVEQAEKRDYLLRQILG